MGDRPTKSGIYLATLNSIIGVGGLQFAKDQSGRLYYWTGSKYALDSHPSIGGTILSQEIQRKLRGHGGDGLWEDEFVVKIRNHVLRSARDLWERPPKDKINVLNGILNLRTLELTPSTPDTWRSTIQFPVEWRPGIQCPRWDSFLSSLSYTTPKHFLQQFIGTCLTPGTDQQTGIWFKGPPGTGKSTLSAGIMGILGNENCLSFDTSQFDVDRFLPAQFAQKLLWADLDLKDNKVKNAQILKKMITGDRQLVQDKWGQPFGMEPFGKLIVCCNSKPKFYDNTPGMARRVIMVPIERIWREGDVGFLPQGKLLAHLLSPDEMSGILNHAVEGWREIDRGEKFDLSADILMMTEKFRAESGPIAQYLDHATVSVKGGLIIKEDLFEKGNKWIEEEKGQPPIDHIEWGKAIKLLRPDWCEEERRVGGKRAFVGAGFLQ